MSYRFRMIRRDRTGARILAEHPTKTGSEGQKLPFMAIYYVPPGRVLWHATDETFRWRYRIGDTLFARYWVQAIRYLSRAKLLGTGRAAEMTVDRREYRRGELVRTAPERQATADHTWPVANSEVAGGS